MALDSCLGAEAATVVDPACGGESLLDTHHRKAGKDVVDVIGYPLMSTRPAVIHPALWSLDGLEADDLSQLADRLEHGSAARTHIADQALQTCRAMYTAPARDALEMGHQAALAHCHTYK
jgi:hypothetical protein